MKIHYPFNRPAEGVDVVWRCEARSYSYIIDADREEYGSTAPILELTWWHVTRRTPKGAWVGTEFCLLSARRARFRNTPEEAVASFVKRRERQIKILERQLERAKFELALTADNALQGLLP